MRRLRGFPGGPGLVVLAAAAVFPVAAARGDDPTPLRWSFKPGQTIRYEFRQKNGIKVDSGGQVTVNATEFSLRLTWEVRSVAADGTAEVTQSVDKVRVAIDTGAQKIKYASDDGDVTDPSARALATVYKAAIASPSTLKVDARGRVVEARVAQAVTDAVRGSPFQTTADGGSIFSELGLKNMYAQVLPALPEKPVAPGATWENTLDLPSPPLLLTVRNRYTLAKVEGKTAVIEAGIGTAIKTDPISTFRVEVKKEGGAATFRHDTQTGRLAESSLRQTLDLRLGLPNGDVAEEVSIEAALKRLP